MNKAADCSLKTVKKRAFVPFYSGGYKSYMSKRVDISRLVSGEDVHVAEEDVVETYIYKKGDRTVVPAHFTERRAIAYYSKVGDTKIEYNSLQNAKYLNVPKLTSRNGKWIHKLDYDWKKFKPHVLSRSVPRTQEIFRVLDYHKAKASVDELENFDFIMNKKLLCNIMAIAILRKRLPGKRSQFVANLVVANDKVYMTNNNYRDVKALPQIRAAALGHGLEEVVTSKNPSMSKWGIVKFSYNSQSCFKFLCKATLQTDAASKISIIFPSEVDCFVKPKNASLNNVMELKCTPETEDLQSMQSKLMEAYIQCFVSDYGFIGFGHRDKRGFLTQFEYHTLDEIREMLDTETYDLENSASGVYDILSWIKETVCSEDSKQYAWRLSMDGWELKLVKFSDEALVSKIKSFVL